MPDAAAFQHAFGAALAGRVAVADPAIARALAIHRNTATKAAVDAIADNYPVVRQLVGEEAFTAAALDHVAARPPADPRLCLYGADWAAFLAGYAPFRELPWLAAVARVERMVVEALFAADAAPLAGDAIALDLEATLRLHPAVRVAAFAAPAASIWLAHQPGGPALDAVAWQPETVLVTRPRDVVLVTPVAPAAAAFAEACAAGLPLGEAAAAAGDDLAGVFAALITAGAFA